MFTKWLEEHIRSDMLVDSEDSNRRTFDLREHEEGVRMTLRVHDVPQTAIIMRFDVGDRRPLFKEDKDYDFLKRCDYLILEELDVEYRAIFIELKQSHIFDGDERRSEKKGEKQLRWSMPSLKYLLSVFETDNQIRDQSKRVVARYFLVTKRSYPWHQKRGTREHFRSVNYKGLPIHYSMKDKMKFKDLVSREPISILS